jgi:hypothetical protein
MPKELPGFFIHPNVPCPKSYRASLSIQTCHAQRATGPLYPSKRAMLTELPDLYALHGIGPACFHDDFADMARDFVSKVRAAPRRAFRPDMTSHDWYVLSKPDPSGVTVTGLLCDPLLVRTGLKYRARGLRIREQLLVTTGAFSV